LQGNEISGPSKAETKPRFGVAEKPESEQPHFLEAETLRERILSEGTRFFWIMIGSRPLTSDAIGGRTPRQPTPIRFVEMGGSFGRLTRSEGKPSMESVCKLSSRGDAGGVMGVAIDCKLLVAVEGDPSVASASCGEKAAF
jgi:hypothetical protein